MRGLSFTRSPARGAGEALWLFVHIPKTAGSSFRTALAEQLKPERNINIKQRGVRKRADAFAKAIDEFLTLDKKQRFVFASGHLTMPEVRRIQENIGRPVNLLTMLRDPVQRVISDYRYQRTPAHASHQAFSAAFPTLESFIDSRRSQNKMFRYLALPGEAVEDATARIEREFSLVGVVEMYPQSMKLCSELIGPRFPLTTSLNTTADTGDNGVEVDDELVERISRLNPQDERLWMHFHDRMRSVQGGAARRKPLGLAGWP